MTDYILIEGSGKSLNDVTLKLNNINVAIYLSYEKNNYFYFKIKYKDFEKINKYYKYLNFKIVRYYGLIYYKKILKKYYLIFFSMLTIFLLVFVFSHVIVDVEIDHENEKIVNLLKEELNEYGISAFTLKKSFTKLNEIKEKIKTKYNDKIDWLEISSKGMKYIVKVEEKIIPEKEINHSYCGIYASNDGLIKRFKIYKGNNLIKINDYVKKGDLLVSGDILLNENQVNQVCADASVYAEVWYNVSVDIPFEYYETKFTKKKRNNFVLNINDKDYVLLNDRLKNYESKNKLIFEGLGIKLYLRKDYEVKKKKLIYSEEEIIKKGIDLAKEKINLTLSNDERIIEEKVLQKTANDSTMNMDVFIVVEKQIGSKVILEEK